MSVRELLLATSNIHKVAEFEELLRIFWKNNPTPQIRTLKDFPQFQMPEESALTFAENAKTKASALFEHTGFACLADDSGLSVAALGGKPGIQSARFAGSSATDFQNRQKLLTEMGSFKGGETRKARFVCALHFMNKNYSLTAEGVTEGFILENELGERDFGYDPIFYSNELNKCFGECTLKEKNSVSHRSRAFQKLVSQLESLGFFHAH
jgi:XTP/dITP diphosphohydrolase